MKIAAASHQHAEMTDEDLIEALGYFSDDGQIPVIMATKFEDPETMDSMLLSLEIQQELFSPGGQDIVDKTVSKSVAGSDAVVQRDKKERSSLKKSDRRRKPNSTSKRHNRRRPKHELDYLRAKVAELQEELAKVSQAEMSVISKNMDLAIIETTSGLSSWKAIAERQKHAVAVSIDENRKLRNRLLGQLQVSRVLEAAVQHHQSEAATWSRDLLTSSGICRVRRPLVMTTDEHIFAQLNSQIETQFAEVDSIFTTHGLSYVQRDLQGGVEFKREKNGMSFRHEGVRLLPFPFQTLHCAIWNSLHNGPVVETESQVLNKDHSNLIWRNTLQLSKSHRVDVTKRSVLRRHMEQDRVVFVWSSYVEIDGFVSVRLREKGWNTASNFELHRGVTQGASTSNNFERGCITRMAIELNPEVPKFKSDQEARMHVGGITDLIVGYCQMFGLVHEVVERRLINADIHDNDQDPIASVVHM